MKIDWLIDSYEYHENFQKYVGGVACCEYGINVSHSTVVHTVHS